MEATKFNFTDARLSKLQPVKEKRSYYYDSKTPGLRCQVTPTGSKTFQYQSWDPIRKRPATKTLGKYPGLSIQKARRLAGVECGKVAAGVDIENEVQAARQEWTFDELFNYWLENHAKPHKRSWNEDHKRYKLYIENPFGKKKLSWCTPDRIRKWHSDIRKMKKQRGEGTVSGTTANRAFALVRTVFNQTRPDEPNPCRGVKLFKEESRDRFLRPAELQRFFSALDEPQTPKILRDYTLVSLFTGARRSNVMAMKWADIAVDESIWTIPANESKNGEIMTVPLVPAVVEILERRKAFATSIYVFPGSGKTGHLVEPKTAWRTLLKRAKLANVRLHDLRRTMGSFQTMTGASLTVVGKTLGHKSHQATAVYSRLDLDPVRQSMETAVEAMLAAKGAPEKVTNLNVVEGKE